MKKVDICLLPELIKPEMVKNKTVVVIDVFRASSAIITGLANGVEHFLAVTDPKEAKEHQGNNYLAAGERRGEQLPGFDLGNSPYEYRPQMVDGKQVVITTSNGTRAIAAAQGAKAIFTACFLNKSSMLNYLNQQADDILLLCSGSHGMLSLEDTVFAGAMLSGLENFHCNSDECFLSDYLYQENKQDLLSFLNKGAHAQRLQNLGFEKDINYCLQVDKFDFLATINNFKIQKY